MATNGNSWVILDGLRDDLKSYLETNRNNNEKFIVRIENKDDVQLLEDADKKRIKDFHVGMYEISPSDLLIAGGGKTINELQAYEIKIFMALSKSGQYDENAERRMMNAKDLVFDWIQQTNDSGGTDLNSITSGNLLQLQFNNLDPIIRQDRYLSLTMQIAGFRNEI